MNNIPKLTNRYYPYANGKKNPKNPYTFPSEKEKEEDYIKSFVESTLERSRKRAEERKSLLEEKTAPTIASQIKKDVEGALEEKYGTKHEGAFSQIDDTTVERNVSLAEKAIKDSIKRGNLKEGEIKNFPHLLSGLTMFYASAEQGNNSLANKAYKAAYTNLPDAKIKNTFLTVDELKNASVVNMPLTDLSEPQITKYSNSVTSPKEQENSARYVGTTYSGFYTDANIFSDAIDVITKGSSVNYTGEKKKVNGKDWAKVEYNGRTGWVLADDLRFQNPFSPVQNQNTVTPSNTNISNTPPAADNVQLGTEIGEENKSKDQENARFVGKGTGFYPVPSANSEAFVNLKSGDEVKYTGIKKTDEDSTVWAQVTYDGKTGWVKANDLRVDRTNIQSKESQETPSISKENIRYAGKTGAKMYVNPTLRSSEITYIDPMSTVQYTGNSTNHLGYKWAEVIYNGQKGWVMADNLRLTANEFVDSNTPKNLFVQKQNSDIESRTKYLTEKNLEWMRQTDGTLSEDFFKWYEGIGAKVRYTGPYVVPVPIEKINQGFYGTYSHAGKHGNKFEEGKFVNTGHLGAIDFQAPKGTPIYSTLPGKVVYVPNKNGKADFHRVTVETKINGEIYYIEYLHLDKILVDKNSNVLMGAQIGTSGGWGYSSPDKYPSHLDFRIYQFIDNNNKDFSSDSAKHFYDPFEFFDFDVQFNENLKVIDYH